MIASRTSHTTLYNYTDQTPPHCQRGILEAHACISPREKWPTARRPYNAASAVTLERRGVRKNATNFLTFIAYLVRDSVFRTNRCSKSEM